MKAMRYMIILMLFFYVLHCSGQKHLLYDSLNSVRSAQGLPALRRSILLEIRAKVWLMKMQRYGGRLVHGDGPEVLTTCYDPVGCWMESKPHRKLLMSDRKRIGIALYKNFACGKLR